MAGPAVLRGPWETRNPPPRIGCTSPAMLTTSTCALSATHFVATRSMRLPARGRQLSHLRFGVRRLVAALCQAACRRPIAIASNVSNRLGHDDFVPLRDAVGGHRAASRTGQSGSKLPHSRACGATLFGVPRFAAALSQAACLHRWVGCACPATANRRRKPLGAAGHPQRAVSAHTAGNGTAQR